MQVCTTRDVIYTYSIENIEITYMVIYIYGIGAIGSMIPTWWKMDEADDSKTCIAISIAGSLAFLTLVMF